MPSNWYYTKEQQEFGPVSPGELKRLASAGQLSRADSVRREDMNIPMPAGKINGLFSNDDNGNTIPPLPPPLPSQWYYAKSGQRLGPVTIEELHELALNRELRPTDLIWQEGMGDWEPASKLTELFHRSDSTAFPPLPKDTSSYIHSAKQFSSDLFRSIFLKPSFANAGFWKRLASELIDCVICLFGGGTVAAIAVALCMMPLKDGAYSEENRGILIGIITLMIRLWYFSTQESSPRQATIGKMIMGIKVTDTSHSRLSLKQAFTRVLIKDLVWYFTAIALAALLNTNVNTMTDYTVFWILVLAGSPFIMAGITKNKQCFHDILADCYVVNKRAL